MASYAPLATQSSKFDTSGCLLESCELQIHGLEEVVFMSSTNKYAKLDPVLCTPNEHGKTLLERAVLIMDYFSDYVSNPYFGKTINLRGRFNKHHLQKQKSNEMIVMLALTVLGEEDIPAWERNDASIP